VGLREHHGDTERTDIHVFDQWCHLATVQSEDDLQDTLHSRVGPLAFDLDTYRLVLKHLLPGGRVRAELIEFKKNEPLALMQNSSPAIE
jgi:DNA polymerase-3 subunit epsilon